MAVLQYATGLYALEFMPEMAAFALLMLQPFFILTLSGVFYRERVTKFELFCITGSFVSTLLIISPDLFLKKEQRTSTAIL